MDLFQAFASFTWNDYILKVNENPNLIFLDETLQKIINKCY